MAPRTLAARLVAARKSAELRPVDVARRLEVTQSAVQQWETGATRPTYENLAALAALYRVSFEYLATGSEAKRAG